MNNNTNLEVNVAPDENKDPAAAQSTSDWLETLNTSPEATSIIPPTPKTNNRSPRGPSDLTSTRTPPPRSSPFFIDSSPIIQEQTPAILHKRSKTTNDLPAPSLLRTSTALGRPTKIPTPRRVTIKPQSELRQTQTTPNRKGGRSYLNENNSKDVPQTSPSPSSNNDTEPTHYSLIQKFQSRARTVWRTIVLYFKSLWALMDKRDYIVSVDQSFYWRRSLVWSHDNGGLLKAHLTQRYSSTSVLAGLLVTAEINVLFSPSDTLNEVRAEALEGEGLSFGIVMLLCFSIIFTMGTILSTFTAWAMFGAISDRNIHALGRSAIGLYSAQIPTSLLIFSYWSFIMSMLLLFYKLVPNSYAIALTVVAISFTFHITTTFSVFGRIILHANAMSEFGIFGKEEEDTMLPVPLFENLLIKAKENKGVPVSIQYRRNLKRAFEKGEDVTVINRLNETRRSERKIMKRRRRHTIGDPKGFRFGYGGKSSDDIDQYDDWMTITTKNTTPTQAQQTPRSVPSKIDLNAHIHDAEFDVAWGGEDPNAVKTTQAK